jgi:GH35 family endo-1,4-beta-xylanase
MQVVSPTPEWKEYRFLGYAPASFPAEAHQAKFFLGYGPGTVEVAGVQVLNHGRAPMSAFDQTIDYWGGREHSDAWREAALRRIEQLRKGDLTLKVVDAAGRPVSGATVKVAQQRHYFRFGTAAPAGRFLDTVNPDNLRFQQETARLFNTVTFENDLKWTNMGDGSLKTQLAAADWLKAHGLDLRGHCLVWGSYHYLPKPVADLRGDALRQAITSHVTDYASRMRGKLYLWDVVNEAGSNTEVWDNTGWESFADVFRRARAADPDARLCYNDYDISQENPGYRNKVRARIQYLLDQQAPLDVLGDQGHMNTPLTPISRVLEIWDEWAKFGKDLEITEYDLGCWDDKVHGDYTRDYLTAAFSHPAMKSFIMWGFWAGSHWRAKDGGATFFTQDWSRRPALDAYEDLVFKQWWTRWEGRSAPTGEAKLRAFYGRHEVTAEAEGKRGTATVELRPGSAPAVEIRLR